jgi:hypothetical protein
MWKTRNEDGPACAFDSLGLAESADTILDCLSALFEATEDVFY